MSVIIVRGRSTGGSGVYSQAEKLAIEMEMAFKASNINNYKELIYNATDLIEIDYYTDNTKITKLFDKILSYNSGKLVQTILTRIDDGSTLTKSFSYDINDNLESVEAVAI